MPLPKLLWITTDVGVQAQPEWLEVLAEFAVIPVAGIAGAQAALTGEDVDCVLVHGPLPDEDRSSILEALRDIDGILPVVFFDLEMTAAEAVRLHRSGAYHCLGFRDSLAAVRD